MTFSAGTPITASDIIARRTEALERISRDLDEVTRAYVWSIWTRMMGGGAGLPLVSERNAEQDPGQMCQAGEHGWCNVKGCGCWCHRERLDK